MTKMQLEMPVFVYASLLEEELEESGDCEGFWTDFVRIEARAAYSLCEESKNFTLKDLFDTLQALLFAINYENEYNGHYFQEYTTLTGNSPKELASWLESKKKSLKLTHPYVCGGGHTQVGETHCSNSNLTYN
jgi:hypothetical protein